MARGTDVTDMKRAYRTVVEGGLPDSFSVRLAKESDLRYGENPNQSAGMFRDARSGLAELTDIKMAKSGKGGLSATNYMDVTSALNVLKFFDAPAVAVMKHLVPSGFARQYGGNDLASIYEAARDTDARSAFGSVVALNRPLDKATAEAITSTYVEGVAAPEFEEGVMDILERKKDIRVISFSNLDEVPKFIGDGGGGVYDIRTLPTGRVLVQQPYLSSIRGPTDLIFDSLVKKGDKSYIVNRDPTFGEVADLMTAWYVNLGVRSNGIVFVKDGVTVAVGTGQQERVGAIEHAVVKAYQKAMDREGIVYDPIDGAAQRHALSENPLDGAVMSSDAFFPFRDSIDVVAAHGVSAVIQPGGSTNDSEVIEAVNEHGMSMTFTRERCFGHF